MRIASGLLLLTVLSSGCGPTVQHPANAPTAFPAAESASLTFRMFGSFPMERDKVDRILKERYPSAPLGSWREGYSFRYEGFANEVGLRSPYFLRIGESIVLDRTSSFRIVMNESIGEWFAEIIGEKTGNSARDMSSSDRLLIENLYIVNIDENFLKRNTVALHPMRKFVDAALREKVFSEAIDGMRDQLRERYSYLQRLIAKQEGVDEKEDAKDDQEKVRQEMVAHFDMTLYQFGDIPPQECFAAAFEPKKDMFPLHPFVKTYVDERFAEGCSLGVTSFSINSQRYMACIRSSFGSGEWGKVLYRLENGGLMLVVEDYSYAD